MSYGKILLIEDELEIASEIREAFENIGFEVGVANTAEEALNSISIGAYPDIIISDINLPGMHGLDLAMQLSEMKPEDEPSALVFLSGHATSANLKSALKLRAVDFIEKPVSLTELLDRILEIHKNIQNTKSLLDKEKSYIDDLNEINKKLNNIIDDYNKKDKLNANNYIYKKYDKNVNDKDNILDLIELLKIINNSKPSLFSGDVGEQCFWDILLYISENELRFKKKTPITAACFATSLPQSTSMRKIAILEENGILERSDDQHDKRQKFLSLTALGLSHVTKYLGTIALKLP